MNVSSERIISLYRAYRRQVRALPHIYLRIKSADDFRSVLKTKSIDLRRKKLKRVSKDLQRLQAANGGESTAFNHILDTTYGRVGKLRRELIEPLLSDPNTLFLPTNLRKEKTYSPVYSPELVALLTSGVSRTTRAVQKHHLISPPGLPGRATSAFEDMVLLGPLSRRRAYNIRWRFFNNESKKVYPPLQLSLQHPTNRSDTHIFSNQPLSLGFQNAVTLQELLTLAGSPSSMLLGHHSKQRRLQGYRKISGTDSFDGILPVRWLRRRYQALLGKIPVLIPRPSLRDNFNLIYDVQLADNAITPSRPQLSRLRVVDVKDVSWISDVHLS